MSTMRRRTRLSLSVSLPPTAATDSCWTVTLARSQVDNLDEILSRTGHRVDAVICLHAGEDELVERLMRRGREQGRTDDTEQTIRTRLAVYSQQTAPLIDTYRKRGLLAEVDGLGTVGAVSTRILKALTSSGY
jgi:adenylate kinase